MLNKLLLLVIFINYLSFAGWNLSSPGNSNVYRLIVNIDTIFIWAEGRLFYSYDNANNWKQFMPSGLPSIIKDGSRIVKNGDFIFISSSDGLYKCNLQENSFKKVVLNEKDPWVWDATTYNDTLYCLNNSNIYCSTDNGDNWTSMIRFEKLRVRKIKVNSKYIIVSCGDINVNNQSPKYNPELAISTDKGNTWNIIQDSSSGLVANSVTAIDIDNNNIIIGTQKNGVYLSSDDGNSWKSILPNIFAIAPISSIKLQDSIFYASFYYGLIKCNLNDLSYQYIAHNNVNDFAVINDKIYLASYGLHISNDKGFNWDTVQIPAITIINDIKNFNNKFWVTTDHKGVFSAPLNLNNWNAMFKNLPFKNFLYIEFVDSTVFLTTYTGQIAMSTNMGKHWTILNENNGLPNVFKSKVIYHPIKNLVLLCTQYGWYASTDKGYTWNKYFESPDAPGPGSLHFFGDTIIGNDRNGIHISTDFGKTWRDSYYNEGLPGVITSFDIVMCDNVIIAATKNTVDWNDPKGLYKSTDFGYSWNQINDETTILNYNDINNYDNYIFATSDSLFLFSSDCGETWSILEEYKTNAIMEKIYFSNGNIYVASNFGVLFAPLSNFGVISVEENIDKIDNYLYVTNPYPTPSSDYVNLTVYFDSHKPFDLKNVKIVNIFGEEINYQNSISFEYQTIYKGILTWNCSNVPDGVYLVIINRGSTKSTTKVLVSK